MKNLSLQRIAIIGLLTSFNLSCGRSNPIADSNLKSNNEPGSMAIEGEGSKARILVQLVNPHDEVVLCLGDLDNCLKSDGKQIMLSKTPVGYHRSQEAVDLKHNLVLHVLAVSSTGRKSILSAAIKDRKQSDNTNSTELPPPIDIPTMRQVPGVNMAYDYMGTMSRVAANAAVVRIKVQGGKLLGTSSAVISGTISNLRNSKISIPLKHEASIKDGILDFTVNGLEPDTVYRIENLSLTDKNNSANFEKSRDSYYILTASDSKLAKSRRLVALQALSESYDWDHGNYDSSKGYASGWGWCDYFYTWALSRQFKIAAGYSSKAFFNSYGSLHSGDSIKDLGEKESLTGDLVRYEGTFEGTHTFMILSYDIATKNLWSVEGNFNRRVMRNQRQINSPWMHGHLTEAQIHQ